MDRIECGLYTALSLAGLDQPGVSRRHRTLAEIREAVEKLAQDLRDEGVEETAHVSCDRMIEDAQALAELFRDVKRSLGPVART